MEFLKRFHLMFFGHPMGRQMERFVVGLSWFMLSGVLAILIIFGANVMAARWLGPEEYGKYNLVLAISGFILILMLGGMEVAAGRYLAIEKDPGKRSGTAAFLYRRTVRRVVVVAVVAMLAIVIAGRMFGIGREILAVSLVTSIFLSFRGIGNGILRGMNLFKLQGFFRFSEAVIIVVALGIALWLAPRNYLAYALAALAGYALFAILAWTKIDLIKSAKGATENAEIVSYANLAITALLANFIFNGSERIVIERILGLKAVGMYSAYFSISVGAVNQIRHIFINVFFPEIARSQNRLNQLYKIRKIALVLFAPWIIAMCIFIYLVMLLFGKEYEVNPLMVVAFALFSYAFFFMGVSQWFLASISRKAMVASAVIAASGGAIQIVLSVMVLWLTKNISYFALALFVSSFIYWMVNDGYIKKFSGQS